LLPSGLTWVLVYRTEKYQKLKTEVEKQSKKRKWVKWSIKRSRGNPHFIVNFSGAPQGDPWGFSGQGGEEEDRAG